MAHETRRVREEAADTKGWAQHEEALRARTISEAQAALRHEEDIMAAKEVERHAQNLAAAQ
eukprot:10255908-Prorocentrum_lima.AAC.1